MISSGLLLMYGAGAIIGPFLASTIMTVLGGASLFLFAAFCHCALALYVALRSRHESAVPTGELAEFNESLTSALTASQVYEEEIESEN